MFCELAARESRDRSRSLKFLEMSLAAHPLSYGCQDQVEANREDNLKPAGEVLGLAARGFASVQTELEDRPIIRAQKNETDSGPVSGGPIPAPAARWSDSNRIAQAEFVTQQLPITPAARFQAKADSEALRQSTSAAEYLSLSSEDDERLRRAEERVAEARKKAQAAAERLRRAEAEAAQQQREIEEAARRLSAIWRDHDDLVLALIGL